MITWNTGHIQKMPIMTEQYLREQIVKSTGHLKDAFTNRDPIRHDRIFKLYTT